MAAPIIIVHQLYLGFCASVLSNAVHIVIITITMEFVHNNSNPDVRKKEFFKSYQF